jgi:uncharacterized protein YeaO (DUF488 family)
VTLLVHTARISYGGPDRLDITRKGNHELGVLFAPSDALLWPYVAKRREGVETQEDFDAYREAFTVEMRRSYVKYRVQWHVLLARESVTLVCFCTDPQRCHRRLVAGMLVKLGAIYEGERDDK